MIMRITWGNCGLAVGRNMSRPIGRPWQCEVPGLRGRWLAQDVNDPDGGFAVSVWESLDAMHAYEQRGGLQTGDSTGSSSPFLWESTPRIGVTGTSSNAGGASSTQEGRSCPLLGVCLRLP